MRIKVKTLKKVSAIKNAIIVIEFPAPQHLMYLGWTFATELFSALYHPQDARDEKDFTVFSSP